MTTESHKHLPPIPKGAVSQTNRSLTIYVLNDKIAFPKPEYANEEGLLAIGGDLTPARLELAYKSGIFPWYSDDLPILWYSPDPRMVLCHQSFRINRSLRKTLKKLPFHIQMDTSFRQVIQACASVPRNGQAGTWITDEMLEAYVELHSIGLAHSIETWQNNTLVGGLYGVSIGGGFFGESMFSLTSHASKASFVALVHQLSRWSIHLIDCQVYTDYLASFGAELWPRKEFLKQLKYSIQQKTRQGNWTLDADLSMAPFGQRPR